MINAWQWEKSEAIAFPACKCKSRLNFRVRDQFEINILKERLMKQHLFHMHFKKIELEPAIIWKVATCQRISSKYYSNSEGRYMSPRYGQTILVSRNSCFDSCQLIKTWMYNIMMQAPKLARKCEIKHSYACVRTDGRSGGRCTVTWLPNFLGWIDFL